ncbi:unnamed protein product [Arabis nemorensis]|uniref:Leucine-rich repeat-containing N-terminal plant-type domain-containing protein n=1 Tax=Arabis nemorensis TaxID=586526 RepID=A0A565AQE1_9BRAS|nr:unnamed protein product [Arabis nemorensis]
MSFKAKELVRPPTTKPALSLNSHMHLFLLCVLFLSAFFLTVSEAFCNPQDRESPMWFSGNVSSSVSPLNWNSSIDCCSWEGITCDDSSESHVTAISLPSRELSGHLRSSVQTLHHLSRLDLSYNSISGPLPPGLFSALDQLMVVNLSFNSFNGELPLEQAFGDGSNRFFPIHTIDLSSNLLQGEILSDSTFIQRAINLISFNASTISPVKSQLNLRVNRLGGTLSEVNFSRFQSLSILDLGNNSFTGNFPDTVFSCKSLTAIRFAGNKLTRQISPQVRELEALSYLSFSDNKLTNITGALSILQGCRKLSTLVMAKNLYDETVSSNEDFLAPDGIPNLQIFGIGGSRLKGSIPGWLGTLPHLFYIDLSDNLLSGELPKEFFQLRALMSQKAYDATEKNYLELPIFLNPNNVTINQQYIQLSGSIPVDVGQLKVLHVLELLGNNLSGSIPDEVSNLTNLERLDLSDNSLSGEIPWSLTSLLFQRGEQQSRRANTHRRPV